MPTIEFIGPYRIGFYSGDGSEPPHVHVYRDARETKFWLTPVSIAWARGFRANELLQIERMVIDNQYKWLRKWNEYFDRV
jgi:hypothetical protein